MEFAISPTGIRGRAAWPLSRRLEDRIKRDHAGCWIWTGAASPLGYGRVTINGKGYQAYRVIYQLYRGPIPTGLVLDHVCRNPACVNPDHLEPVSQRENVLRGVGISAKNIRKTSCLRGHPLSGLNLRISRTGSRECRECRRIRDRHYREKARAL